MMSPSLRVVGASLATLLLLVAGVAEAFQLSSSTTTTTTTARSFSAASPNPSGMIRGSGLVHHPSFPDPCCRRPRALGLTAKRDDDGDTDTARSAGGGGFFQAVGSFFEELDAFMDDASARRLGNGAAFYGKRRSNFYGDKDKNKKRDRTVFDPTEDYQGPSTSGFFKWMPDEDGEMRPVTRMKNQVIERKKAPQQKSSSWFGRSNND